MFFIAIFGINDEMEKLNWHKNSVCKSCGRLSAYDGYMSYSVFNFFFIPIFKFNKKYFIKSACCGAMYEVSKEKGVKMEMGEYVDFTDDELRTSFSKPAVCRFCGYPLESDHIYCPRCGNKI